MWRAGLPAAVISLLLAACGGGAKSDSSTARAPQTPGPGRLSVSPATPRTSSRVTFSFTAPTSSGRNGASVRSFALAVSAPHRTGCGRPRTAIVPPVVKGHTASVRFMGPWCAGAYSAQVDEFSRAYCKPGQMCPHYVRLVGTVARTTFRIVAG